MQGQGQAQEARVAQITRAQSIVLLKNMIRISVSSICYQRGVFEEDCFKCKPYDGLPIHQLDSAGQNKEGELVIRNSEAFSLTQWLERGVFKALEQEYLSGLTFALCSKQPVTGEDILLEKYEFKLTYAGENTHASINGHALDSKNDLKSQAKKFLRSLIAFVETLDDLPEDRWLTMMLKYCDDVPADFQPEYFRSCNQGALQFGQGPIKVKLGNLNTQHMGMNVVYSGLESLLYEDLCKVVSTPIGLTRSMDSDDETVYESKGVFQGSKVPPKGKLVTQSVPMDSEENHEEMLVTNLASLSCVLTTPPVLTEAEKTTLMLCEDLKKVKNYVLTKSKANVKDCKIDLKLSEARVERAFQEMMTDGLIKRRGNGYTVEKKVKDRESATPTCTSAVQDSEAIHQDTAPCDTAPQDQISSSSYSERGRVEVPPSAPRKKKAEVSHQHNGFSHKEPVPVGPSHVVTGGRGKEACHSGLRGKSQVETIEEIDDNDETQVPDDEDIDMDRHAINKRNRETPSLDKRSSGSGKNDRMPALDMQQQLRKQPLSLTKENIENLENEDSFPRNLSQTSEQSEMSLGGTGRYSIITDPIHQIPKRQKSNQDGAYYERPASANIHNHRSSNHNAHNDRSSNSRSQ